jgi:hypothetical protein
MKEFLAQDVRIHAAEQKKKFKHLQGWKMYLFAVISQFDCVAHL